MNEEERLTNRQDTPFPSLISLHLVFLGWYLVNEHERKRRLIKGKERRLDMWVKFHENKLSFSPTQPHFLFPFPSYLLPSSITFLYLSSLAWRKLRTEKEGKGPFIHLIFLPCQVFPSWSHPQWVTREEWENTMRWKDGKEWRNEGMELEEKRWFLASHPGCCPPAVERQGKDFPFLPMTCQSLIYYFRKN